MNKADFESALDTRDLRVTENKVMFINNEGGGFANEVSFDSGDTVSSFFTAQMETASVEDYMVRVNRQSVTGDYVLQPGDRVSVTPVKIQGA